MQWQLPKGTFDILPYGTKDLWKLSSYWQFLENLIRQIAREYGYLEIRTPIYEKTELFLRGIGETSDIVMKEMFTFEDKAQRSLSLRPEGTASVMRSFIEHHLDQLRPAHKLFYIGPMFRYERPQSGRYRQHHQFGIEALGIEEPELDAEIMDLLYQLYTRLGLKNLTVQINTVGDPSSRNAFRQALISYLTPFAKELSMDSQLRLEKNPLRILDSKDPTDRKILQEAPSIFDYLTQNAKEHFDRVCACLEDLSIPYQINPQIVRGLDYYQHTVFEITTDHLGAQNTLGAGGRYDGLIHSFGGPDLPGVGCATGLERVLQLMVLQEIQAPLIPTPFVHWVGLGAQGKQQAFRFVAECRKHHIPADLERSQRKVGTILQTLSKAEVPYCIILGDDEMKTKTLLLKSLNERSEIGVSFDEILSTLKKLYAR